MPSQRFVRYGSFVLTALVCLVLFAARMRASGDVSRYCGHMDEKFIYQQALDVIEGDDLNPDFFKYPSLPIYLTAAAIRVATAFDDRRELDHVFKPTRRRGEPYEPAARVVPSRLFFGLLGACLFALLALVAGRLAGGFGLAWAAAMAMSLSPLIQRMTLSYQNVDTPTAFFAFATLAALVLFWESDSLVKSAIVPGVLAGLTVACKYNSGLIVVSCALAILLPRHRTGKRQKLLVLATAAATAFIVAVPYALLDFERFYADVMYQVAHYRKGHPGSDGPPGIAQLLFYLKALLNDHGPVVLGLAVIGVVHGMLRAPRMTLAVLAFPVLMLLHMSTNRVHFLRTVLPVFIAVPVFAAVGLSGLMDIFRNGVKHFGWTTRTKRVLSGVLPLAVLVATGWGVAKTSDIHRFADRNIKRDTRDRASDWITQNTTRGATVYLATDIWMPSDALKSRRVFRLPGRLQNVNAVVDWDAAREGDILVLTRYTKPSRVPKKYRKNESARTAYLNSARETARELNREAARLVDRLRAERFRTLKGAKTKVTASGKGRAGPVRNPYIEIYRLP